MNGLENEVRDQQQQRMQRAIDGLEKSATLEQDRLQLQQEATELAEKQLADRFETMLETKRRLA